jgi:hypothetical protein
VRKVVYQRNRETQRGSVTVEAAIVVPAFLCVIISIVFLLKAVYIREIIQHAIDEAARELSTYSYVSYAAGLNDLHDSIDSSLNQGSKTFDTHVSSILDSYRDLNSVFGALNTIREISSNPLGELKNIVCKVSDNVFEDIKTENMIPIIDMLVKKHLSYGEIQETETEMVDDDLKKLNISNGFDGLDFSKSRILKDEDKNIEIVVEYVLKLPLPLNVLPEMRVTQKAVSKAWLGGDNARKPVEEDIWSLDNFSRGKRVREIFKANLPWSFPGISSFYSGKAVLIRSMDLTALSYQTDNAVKERICEYVDALVSYQGQEVPWGSEKIIIEESEIRSRQLILVIPRNQVKKEILGALNYCRHYAQNKGISLKIEYYGYKYIKD